MASLKHAIDQYYQAFNAGNDDQLCSLLHDEVLHEINQGHIEVGVGNFKKFMEHMRACYKENVSDLVVLTNEQLGRGSAEFMVKGSYIKTDPPLPPASGQTYALRVGAFFSMDQGKISRVTTYYNLKKWLNLIGGKDG